MENRGRGSDCEMFIYNLIIKLFNEFHDVFCFNIFYHETIDKAK